MKEIICTTLILKDGQVILEYPTSYVKTGYIVRSFKRRIRNNPNDPILEEIAKGDTVILTDHKEQNTTYTAEEFLELIQDTTVPPKDRRPKVEREAVKTIRLGGQPVRLFLLEGKVYAGGKDVCRLFGYSGNVVNMLNTYLKNLVKAKIRTNEPEFDDYYVIHLITSEQVDELSTHYKFLKDAKSRKEYSRKLLDQMELYQQEYNRSAN